MKSVLFTAIFISISCFSFGQHYKKGVRHLSKGENEKAISAFQDCLSKDSSLFICNYGLALAYSRSEPTPGSLGWYFKF